jgi:GTP-binding protein HflX
VARNLTEISREVNRQVGLLVSRKGDVLFVIVGDHRGIVIPDLARHRFASTRLKGLRLIHTHLNSEPLSRDDLTDLALLRLDLVCAVETDAKGLPGKVHTAHLIPENPEGRYWLLLEPRSAAELELNFLDFIQALEEELAGKQKTRKVDATERAILVRVETSALHDSRASLDELEELAASAGVQVFDRVVQRRDRGDPRFLMGRGRLSDLVIKALQMGANLLIFDHELSAAQVRSITDFTEIRVIDRTQLILDIFAQRAHSREGKIQVELAS